MPQDRYHIADSTLGEGAYAEVYRAVHRETGAEVALKLARKGPEAQARIRMEIEAQKILAHPNIMPIRDHDPGFLWYTMPVADGTMKALRPGLDEESLISILLNLADALKVAHRQNLIHRDISPLNILALPGESTGGLRWVVADWGMVRRPLPVGKSPLTKTGQQMGTPGFDAPELNDDPRKATAAVDVYSLGRVAAWFLTGKMPQTGRPLLPDGDVLHWRQFVLECTQEEVIARLSSMDDLRRQLNAILTERDEPPAQRARRLVNGLLRGTVGSLEDLVALAEAYGHDASLFFDQLARVPSLTLRRWVAESPQRAATLGSRMAHHLVDSPWEDRDQQYVGTPLGFVHTVIRALVETGQLGLAQDMAGDFFAADAYWRYSEQRTRTQEWLDELDAPSVKAMIRALGRCGDVVRTYYREGGWRPQSPVLHAFFG
ncbi:serine/threonine-protein kinase [Streptomyces sp. NBC_01294]|uniref:serine/threonine-protein kinase n=1 Tax=Streptomyces sp. NBC_01294 TaxID=2903815 RepID=UPI002DD9D162|nr:serine/threonine-protein kinase [Streptomyces sp. NBC_01294]WRZ61865.1 serine/threonine protein kinase [Streptomyces sp. NBC_01294]